MKRLFSILLLFFCLFHFACKKKSDPNIGVSVQPNNRLDTLVSMTAKVNGVDWKADSVHGYTIAYTADSGRVNLMVTATSKKSDTSTTISYTLSNYVGAGTYAINPPENSAAYYVGNTRHFATSGQIVVDADSAYAIVGTFNFVADSITVTDGVFNVAKP